MSNITLPRDMALHIRDVLLVWSRFSLPADKAALAALEAALAEPQPDAIALVAAAEREACAQVAEAWDVDHSETNYGLCIGNAIRARGTK